MSSILALVLVVFVGCSKPPNDDHHHDNHHHGDEDAGNHHHGDADHHHEAPDLAGIDFGDVEITPAARTYCECLLINCHDPFHDKYGEDDAEAIAACQVDASGFPVAGSAQMSGDSIECRQYHCENVGGDITCAGALGDACL